MNYLDTIELYGAIKKQKKKRKNKKYRNISRSIDKRVRKAVDQFSVDNSKNPTPAERQFKAILERKKFNFTFQKVIKTKKKYRIVDFYLEDYKIVVEVDGGYHEAPDQQKADWERTIALEKAGHKVIRFTNEEVFHLGEDKIAESIIFSICPEAKCLVV